MFSFRQVLTVIKRELRATMSLNKIKSHSGGIWNMFFRQKMKNRYNSFSFAETRKGRAEIRSNLWDAEANRLLTTTHRKSYFSLACLFQFIFFSNTRINVCHEQIPFHTFYFIWYSRVILARSPPFVGFGLAAEDNMTEQGNM